MQRVLFFLKIERLIMDLLLLSLVLYTSSIVIALHQPTKLVSVNDTHGDKGQRRLNINATKLTINTEYNVTVVARNSDGTSPPTKDFQAFMTKGIPEPDPAVPENKTRTPRLGEDTSFHVRAIGNPPPNFSWWHNNVAIKHTDKGIDTTIEIHNITEDDFGDYILNMYNKLGNKNYTFTIKADGPPEPVTNLTCSDVSDNSIELRWKAGFNYGRTQTFQVQGSVNNKPLQSPPEPVSNVSVTNMNSTCAHINFVSGYNYNSTQLFIISVYEDGLPNVTLICKDLTSGKEGDPFTCEICSLSEDAQCSVTVVANNSRGESQLNPEAVKFSIDGKPKPDPHHPSNTTFKPRLGNNVTLSIEVVANPLPKFVWWHNGTRINSKYTNTSSSVDLIDITVDDFGEYVLNVSNEEGYFTTTYEILADGPPEAVTNLTCSDVSDNSIELSWKAGFDYGSTQTFQVQGYVNNKPMQNIKGLKDTTKGKGGQEQYKLDNLESSSTYVIYLVATNARGSASKSNEVAFSTKAAQRVNIAVYIGYILGSAGGFIIVIIILYAVKRVYKRSSESKNLTEENERQYIFDGVASKRSDDSEI